MKLLWKVYSQLKLIFTALLQTADQPSRLDADLFTLAAALGSMDAAAVVIRVRDWCQSNARNQKGYYLKDSQYWTRRSYAQWRDLEFPWLTERKVGDIFRQLVKAGVLVTRTETGSTSWFRVDDVILAQKLTPSKIEWVPNQPLQKLHTPLQFLNTPLQKLNGINRSIKSESLNIETEDHDHDRQSIEENDQMMSPITLRTFGRTRTERAYNWARGLPDVKDVHKVVFASLKKQDEKTKANPLKQSTNWEQYVNGEYAGFIQH